MAVVDGTLVRFTKGQPQRFENPTPVRQLRRGPTGKVYAIRGRQLVALEAGGFEVQATVGPTLEPPAHAVVLSEGRAWVSSPSGVSSLDGDTWTTTSLAELEFDAAPALGLDSSARVWLIGPTRVLYREGDEWTAPAVPPIPPEFDFAKPRTSPLGPIHVTNKHRLTRLATDYFDSVLVDPKAERTYEFLALAPTGHAVVATQSCELGRVPPKPPTRIWRLAAADYPCDRVTALAIDARLRVWIASDHGLSAVTDQRRVEDFPRGTVAALDGEITELLALGEGPTIVATPSP